MRGKKFAALHPAVQWVYLSIVLAVTMFAAHPVLLAINLSVACIYTTLFCHKGTLKKQLPILFLITLVTTLGNGLFSHNGEVVLAVAGDTRYTLEAFFYGMIMGVTIATVLLWFVCMGEILTTDKILYLFGSVFPSVTLTICMMLRYLPMLRRRFEEIHRTQHAMGRKDGIAQRAKEFSVLISWSLENAIDTSDMMEARGYGTGKRSHYSVFVFTARDGKNMAAVLSLGAVALPGVLLPQARAYYFPIIVLPHMSFENLILYTGYLMLLLYPAAVIFWEKSRGRNLTGSRKKKGDTYGTD